MSTFVYLKNTALNDLESTVPVLLPMFRKKKLFKADKGK
jgi:hypothetical protein